MKTIKIFVIVGALTFIIKPLFSQRLIARVGLTDSWITFTGPSEIKFKKGFACSAGIELSLNQYLFIQPEIGFIMKGTDFSIPDNESFSIYYLEIPVPIKYYFGASKVHILIAPVVSIGIGGQYKGYQTFEIEFDGYPEGGYDLANLSYLDNRFDFGLQFGTGIELWNKLIVDIRYTHGFTRLYTNFKRREFQHDDYDNAYNRSFQFTLGVPFSFKDRKNKK